MNLPSKIVLIVTLCVAWAGGTSLYLRYHPTEKTPSLILVTYTLLTPAGTITTGDVTLSIRHLTTADDVEQLRAYISSLNQTNKIVILNIYPLH